MYLTGSAILGSRSATTSGPAVPALAATGTLLPLTAVHCSACPRVVSEVTPVRAHDLMEAHYAEAHHRLISRLGY